MPKISTFVEKSKLSAIKDVLNSIAKTEGVVSLAWGLPNYSLAEGLKEKLINELQNNSNINKYPPFKGLPVLKERIIQKVKKDHGMSIINDNVLITAGAMEGLHIVFQTILNPGDEVIVITPDYASHMGEIELFGGVIVCLPLNEKKGWEIDMDLLRKKISPKTKAILITNPNNPTGTVYNHSALDKIVQLALKKDIFLVSDETYGFLYYGEKPASLMDFKPEKHLVTVESFSKEYAMTGFRVGYIVADSSLIEQMYKAHDAAVGFPPTISQYAAYFALEESSTDVARFYIQDLSEKRQLMMRELEKYKKVLSFVLPAGAYYIFVRYNSSLQSSELAQKLLHEAKVGVVPGAGFGEGGEYHLRLSFAGEKKDIVEGVKRLGEYLKRLGPHR